MIIGKFRKFVFISIGITLLVGCGSGTPTPTPTPTPIPIPTPIVNIIEYGLESPDAVFYKGTIEYENVDEVSFDVLKEAISLYTSGQFIIKFRLNEDLSEGGSIIEKSINENFKALDGELNTMNYTINNPDDTLEQGSITYTSQDDMDLSFINDEMSAFSSGDFLIVLSINESTAGSTKKTGQSISYDLNGTENLSIRDDGYYQAGITASYRIGNDTILDKTSGLMWQDNNAVLRIKKQWITDDNYGLKKFFDTSGDTAATYCKELILDEYDNWRLPTLHELQNIVDYGDSSPAIDELFQNKNASVYWTSTVNSGQYIRGTWAVSFNIGGFGYYDKNTELNIRCVRKTD